jgi:plastocyanin
MNFCVDLGPLKPFLFLSSCLVVGTALVGCGGGVDVPVAKLAPDKPAPTKTVDPATAGSVTGRVTLTGKPEPMRPIDMNSEPSCASAHPSPVIPPAVVIDASGHLANAVVYIKSGVSDYLFHPPAAPAQLTQKGCMYEPHVTAVMAGQNLEVENEDRATHNVFFMAQQNRSSNRSSQPGSQPILETLTVPELAIPVKCNVHPWMKGYVFVFDNPYFAVTQRDGTFSLNGIPPGTYTLAAWQETYGTSEQAVTISPSQAVKVDFVFKAQ